MTAAIECRGLVLHRHNTTPSLETLRVDPPGPGEVRVRMRAAGLCHTDISAVRDARVVPLVLGHEGAGVIEAVGAGVTLQAGTPVLLCWKTPCGHCRRCHAGELHLCESVVGLSVPRTFWRDVPIAPLLNTGCFAEYLVLPAESVIVLDREMPLEQAALVGCAVATGVGAALRTARVEPGAAVGIWGTGGVGLNVLAGARLAHAGTIIAVDPSPERRAVALLRGATRAVAPEAAPDCVRLATAGRGVDYAFEVVGTPQTMAQALAALAPGGTLVLIGAAARDALFAFRPREFMSKQQRIVGCIYGSLRPHVDLPLLLQWCHDGTLPLTDMVGQTVTLDQLPTQFTAASASGVRTVVIFQ